MKLRIGTHDVSIHLCVTGLIREAKNRHTVICYACLKLTKMKGDSFPERNMVQYGESLKASVYIGM